MTERKRLGLPSARLIVIAAIAGILAGAAAVYLKEAGSGNGRGELAADSGQCEGAAKRVAALSPFAKGQVAAMVGVTEPKKLTGLTFKGEDGSALSIEHFAGKTVLLNLWATWCVPCREEMPALNVLEKEMGGQGFEVVAVNIDTGGDEKPKKFLADTGVDALGYYRDSSMGVFNTLKKQGLAFGLPVTLLVDGKGCLLAAMNGPAAWGGRDAKALIKAAIAL